MNTIEAFFSHKGYPVISRIGLAVCGLCFLAAANLAAAVDGAYQINAACAAVGCFSGDTAGYPVTITQSGNYDLVGDLTISDTSTSAIVVQASNVTINMNGFRIVGPTTCSGTPTTCNNPSTISGVGIDGWSYNPTNLVVRNGSITGMGTGVQGSYDGRVEHIQAIQNSYAGVIARTGTTVVDSTGTSNGSIGLEAGLMIGCVASHNGQYGLAAQGLAAQAGGSLIKDSLAVANDAYGIYLGSGSNVVGVTVNENNVGLFANGAAQIVDSLFANNTGFAVTNSQGTLAISRSTFTGNNSGGEQYGGTVVQIGTNLCGASTSCP